MEGGGKTYKGTIPPQMMTCQFNSLWSRIGHQMTFTFSFLILATGIRITTTFALAARFAYQFSSIITSSILLSSELRITLPLPLPI